MSIYFEFVEEIYEIVGYIDDTPLAVHRGSGTASEHMIIYFHDYEFKNRKWWLHV